jgi:hypothetical protein
MNELLLLVSFFLLGPLALIFGADSRDRDLSDKRGWWPGKPR